MAAVLVAACGGGVDDSDPGVETTATTETTPTPGDQGDGGEVGDLALAEECPVGALDDRDDADGPVEIDFWYGLPGHIEAIDALVDAYNRSQDRVVVTAQLRGTPDETLDQYLISLRSGNRPAMVQLEFLALQLGADSGSFIPVQACIDAAGYDLDDYIERAIAAFSIDGVLWPMPFNIANQVLYANRLQLDAAGVTELPTTLAEVRAAAEAIVDTGAATSGLALTSSPWLIEQLFALDGADYADGANGRDRRATELLIDDELGVEIFEWLHEMVADGLAVFVGDGANLEQYLSLAVGRAAMVMDTSAALRGVVDAAATLPGVEIAVGPLPSVGERSGAVAVSGAGLWLDADTTDIERAGVWDFMVYATSPQVQARWHGDTGYVPVRTSSVGLDEVMLLWETEPEFRVAYDQFVDGVESNATAGLVIGNHAQIRAEAVAPALESMYLRSVEPRIALRAAKADADAMIDDYNRRTGN